MEIKLLQKESPVWIAGELIHQQLAFHAESVVPDTAEDVREIVWTRGGLLLKGKEPGLRAFTVTGEAWASVLYLTESGKLDSIRLRKEFEMIFDVETSDPEALPHLAWYLSAVQAKLLNPRKLSVSFEVQAVLKSFRRGSALQETELPNPVPRGLHVLRKQKDTLVLSAVSEKPFTLREQFPLSKEQGSIEKIDAEEVRFDVQGKEQIGARCIVKGEMDLLLRGRDSKGFPVKESFRVPFSQLLDITEDPVNKSSVWIEPNSLYLEWTEGSGEEKSLDLEVHALLQFCAYTGRKIITVSDAYSTRMPMEIQSCDYASLCALESGRALLQADISFPEPDDIAELLAAEAKLGALEQKGAEPNLPLYLDLFYRRKDESLASSRRSFKLNASDIPEAAEVLNQIVLSLSVEPIEKELLLHGQVELALEKAQTETVSTLSLLIPDEENPWSRTESPSVFLVRRAGESLWELAKAYRSSVELICSCNEENADLLLIPAET